MGYQHLSLKHVIYTKYMGYSLGASYYTGLIGNTITAGFTMYAYVLVFLYNRKSNYAIYGKWWGRVLLGIGMVPPIFLWLLTFFNFDMMKVPKVYDAAKGREVRNLASM